MGRPAVFFDRDGVVNRPRLEGNWAHAPLRYADFEIFEGVKEAFLRARSMGFRTFIVTNQPEVAYGNLPLAELNRMHDLVKRELAVDEIFYCPHENKDQCTCRKPKPGMLHQAAEKYGIEICASYLIGDTWKDIEAGSSAGCYTILLQRSYSGECYPDYECDTLEEAIDHIHQRAGQVV
jgi:D-glycero-D-manno-heptose 1,7-bisphosphate phosphatase